MKYRGSSNMLKAAVFFGSCVLTAMASSSPGKPETGVIDAVAYPTFLIYLNPEFSLGSGLYILRVVLAASPHAGNSSYCEPDVPIDISPGQNSCVTDTRFHEPVANPNPSDTASADAEVVQLLPVAPKNIWIGNIPLLLLTSYELVNIFNSK